MGISKLLFIWDFLPQNTRLLIIIGLLTAGVGFFFIGPIEFITTPYVTVLWYLLVYVIIISLQQTVDYNSFNCNHWIWLRSVHHCFICWYHVYSKVCYLFLYCWHCRSINLFNADITAWEYFNMWEINDWLCSAIFSKEDILTILFIFRSLNTSYNTESLSAITSGIVFSSFSCG